MDSVFRHDPTAEELALLFGPNPPTRKEHEALALSDDTENGFLFRLYSLRGEADKAAAYLERIQDAQYRFDVSLMDVH